MRMSLRLLAQYSIYVGSVVLKVWLIRAGTLLSSSSPPPPPPPFGSALPRRRAATRLRLPNKGLASPQVGALFWPPGSHSGAIRVSCESANVPPPCSAHCLLIDCNSAKFANPVRRTSFTSRCISLSWPDRSSTWRFNEIRRSRLSPWEDCPRNFLETGMAHHCSSCVAPA